MIYHKIRLKNQPVSFGHRGAPRLIRENTILSFKKAIILGCNGVETDIQSTKDSKIILFHNHHLIDKNNKKHLINKLNYKEIELISKANNTQPPNTLEQLIAIMKEHENIVFNIEIKSLKINNIKSLKIILEKIPNKTLKEQCIISSFNYCLLFQLNFF